MSEPSLNLDENENDTGDGDAAFEFEAEAIAETPKSRDPAVIAARLLIKRAIAAAELKPGVVNRDGAISIVVAHSVDWAQVALTAWCDWFRPGQRYSQAGSRHDWHREKWAAWQPIDAPRNHDRGAEAESFARAVAQGMHCFASTPDRDWIPRDFVLSADYELVLPVLSGADVGALARELCRAKAAAAESAEVTQVAWFDDAEVALLTPRLLRLARRPGQSANDYISRLRIVLAREEAAKQDVQAPLKSVSSSPREEPTLDRLHGMGEAVAWGMAVASDLAAYREGTLSWAEVDKGCLLSGPPGCGKTLFARALAATCGVPLVTGSYGAWLGTGTGHQGDLLRTMAKTFASARSSAPSILFIDEVDSFPNRAAITHDRADWEIQVVNALLNEIDGVQGRDGVVLIAACNHPHLLDPALVRSGRLDRHIRIGLPDAAALADILREHLGGDLAGADLSLAAMGAVGSSGADCERIVRGARRRARVAGRDIELPDLLSEVGFSDGRSRDELWLAAVHEAGHAVALAVLRPGSLQTVTLTGGPRSGGATASAGQDAVINERDVSTRLIILLAGRAAEHELVGVPSSGAGGSPNSDLALATTFVAEAEAALGLGDGRGALVWTGTPTTTNIGERLWKDRRLAGRVRRRLDEAYAEARKLMRARAAAVETLAAELVSRRVVDGPEAEQILRNAIAGKAR